MKTNLKYQIAAVAMIAGFGLVSFTAEAQKNDSKKAAKKEYKYEKKNERNSYDARSDYHYNSKNERKAYNYNRYQRNVVKSKPYNDQRYAYHHPHYGQVYRQFDYSPVRLKHAHGDFYYHSGSYYTYRPHVGYVRVATPSAFVFSSLPGQYKRVYFGGTPYYRVGDLVFERCSHGYRLAPQLNINLSARF
ncbi:hypothetical protein [Mangrovibacterium sp.]|uniref:hypothetical protein n=1 Tax=Mangrovibacterium sp. TaxID=1961364 RepID=UPI0035672FB9